MTQAITQVSPASVDREALAILGATDTLDGRQLISEAKGDLLPYEIEYQAVVELVELKAEKNHDSRGVRVKMTVRESSEPTKVKVNQSYTLWFFDAHKTLPSMVLAEMNVQRLKFAAAIDGYDGDPLEENADGSPKFKAGPVLLQLHREVEPLGIKLRVTNTYTRSTRNGKRLHRMDFALV